MRAENPRDMTGPVIDLTKLVLETLKQSAALVKSSPQKEHGHLHMTQCAFVEAAANLLQALATCRLNEPLEIEAGLKPASERNRPTA